MKRRSLISLSLGGVVTALSHDYWRSSFGQTTDEPSAGGSGSIEPVPVDREPLLRFIAMGDVGTGGEGRDQVARPVKVAER